MIKVLISDFSRTILFPKDMNAVHEMNSINRFEIAKSLNKPESEISEEELKQGGLHYRAYDKFVLNTPLLQIYKELRNNGISLRIFTSGFVQNHSDLKDDLSIFDEVFNVQENGGYKKTDPKAYTNIIHRLQSEIVDLKAEEILFVDDEELNADAAKKSGMTVSYYPKYIKEMTQEEFLQSAARRFKSFITLLN